MTQEEFNAMLAVGIAQGLPGSYYTSKFANGEEIDRLLSSGGLPSGGAAGMVLGKRSASDYDTAWMSPAQAGAVPLANNAGAHNAIYRGKYLGDTYTAAQQAAVATGMFEDLYIGDYWTIDGVNYRIAAFDYYLGTGDIECTTHHIIVVPDNQLYPYAMNDTDTTEGETDPVHVAGPLVSGWHSPPSFF